MQKLRILFVSLGSERCYQDKVYANHDISKPIMLTITVLSRLVAKKFDPMQLWVVQYVEIISKSVRFSTN